MHDNKEYILGAIRHGADGYILKYVPGKKIIEAIKKSFQVNIILAQRSLKKCHKELAGEQRGFVTRREQLF